jgi:hypothetical protein
MSVQALREALLEHGGTVATVVVDAGDLAEDPTADAPARAARGPRVGEHAAEYELLLEMILEGSLLHYGDARVIRAEDPDLALLLGDQLYALGLSRLAALGDLEAVAELADLISLLAQARAGGNASLAEAIWEAGAAAVGWGSTAEHEAAKAQARRGEATAAQALLQSARRDEANPQQRRGM